MSASEGSVIVVGAGIVGACMVRILAQNGRKVTLLDRAVIEAHPVGSTGLAPGFVATFHTLEVLRTLGKRSAEYYETIQGGFAKVGGIEVAFTQEGKEELQYRASLAEKYGFDARMLDAQEAIALEPRLLDRSGEGDIIAGLLYSEAGTADARVITRHELQQARRHGARFVQATVTAVAPGTVHTVEHGTMEADDIVVCAGIWARELLLNVACYAVAHPYAYSVPHPDAGSRHGLGRSPFIRFFEHHVYARDHGDRFGFGTYGHSPILLSKEGEKEAHLADSAQASWQASFLGALRRDANSTLPKDIARSFGLDADSKPEQAFNGSFSVTPDVKPLAGVYKEVEGQRIFACVAVWVTHAFGTASLLADLILGQLSEQDKLLLKELDPHRFEGIDSAEQERKALATYNDIYVKEG